MDLSHYGLYPHQVAGVLFLARRGRAILGERKRLRAYTHLTPPNKVRRYVPRCRVR